jgi:hypothetical protein
LILIIANRFDLAARKLAEDWQTSTARLITCEDLSIAGWRHFVGGTPPETRTMIGGVAVPAKEISGVLTRLIYIWEQELVHIVAEDRSYVAAEMSAFLMSWLSALDCPVLNRPVPGCLCGPCWRPEQWAVAAARAGMRVRPVRRRVHSGQDSSLETAPLGPTAVTVVGHSVFGEADASFRTQARHLADIAQVDLVRVHYTGGEEGAYFSGADLFPPITDDEVGTAIFNYFRAPGRWSLPRSVRNMIPHPSADAAAGATA